MSDVLDRVEALEAFDRSGRMDGPLRRLHRGGAQGILEVRDGLDRDVDVADAQIVVHAAREPGVHPGQVRLLEQQVARLAGEPRVQATYHEDPSLLGGAVVKLGSTVYDGSVRGQLEQMRQRLATATA